MPNRRQISRLTLSACAIIAAATLAGCGMMRPQSDSSNMVTFTTQLRGANEVPANSSNGSGTVDAVYDKNTQMLRWKASFSGLTGPATMAHFHGPAAVGSNAGVVVPWTSPVASPVSGSATLTKAQADDLMAGRWYANVHTAAHPGGELRGQMMMRN